MAENERSATCRARSNLGRLRSTTMLMLCLPTEPFFCQNRRGWNCVVVAQQCDTKAHLVLDNSDIRPEYKSSGTRKHTPLNLAKPQLKSGGRTWFCSSPTSSLECGRQALPSPRLVGLVRFTRLTCAPTNSELFFRQFCLLCFVSGTLLAPEQVRCLCIILPLRCPETQHSMCLRRHCRRQA